MSYSRERERERERENYDSFESTFQGIAEIGTGVGYACGPVIGGFLYKVTPASNCMHEDCCAINSHY